MLLNLFTAIGAPLYVYAAEFKQFGVWIAGDDFFETANLPQPSSVSLGAPASVFTHRNVTVSLNAPASLKQTWTTSIL